MKRFEKYLIERHFTIYTNHKPLPLIKLLDPTQATSSTNAARIQIWSLYLGKFEYKVEYLEGTDNFNADALCRLPLATPELTLEKPSNVQLVQLALIERTLINSQFATMTSPYAIAS